MSSSNLPRLPWQPSANGGFVAFPNGPEKPDQTAWVVWRVNYPNASPWCWVVRWDGRFSYDASEATKQAAADKATEMWWWGLEQTEAWRPVPPPDPAPPDPLLPQRIAMRSRLLRALPQLSDAEFQHLFFLYRRATSQGPSIEGDRDLDRQAWLMCTDEFNRRRQAYFDGRR